MNCEDTIMTKFCSCTIRRTASDQALFGTHLMARRWSSVATRARIDATAVTTATLLTGTQYCHLMFENAFISMVELDAWRIFVSHGVLPDEILATANSLQSPHSSSPAPFSSTFNFKHKWICSQCYKNGQIVERKGILRLKSPTHCFAGKTNYCSLPRSSHSWRDPLLYVYIGKICSFDSSHMFSRKMVTSEGSISCLQQK